MMKKFKKEESIPEAESVMELKPEEAPEPVPERKTSDEMIEEMAQSAISGSAAIPEKSHNPEALTEEETAQGADPAGPEETADPEELYEPEEPDVSDPSEEVTWLEAEDEEKKDADEEC